MHLSPTNSVLKIQNPTASSSKGYLLTVAIHGNEQCGIHAFNSLLDGGYFDNLTKFHWAELTVCLGNPSAVQANKRFIKYNLNRIFLEHLPTDVESVELERVKVLKSLIEDADAYLDVHSTSSTSKPFAISTFTTKGKRFAESFPVDYVIEDIISTLKGTSLHWAIESGIQEASCVECGHHEAPKTIEIAKECIMHFLESKPSSGDKITLSCTSNQILNAGFEYLIDVEPFQFVEFNELIARDQISGDIRCPYERGAYLIMPQEKPFVYGEEAWFWGVDKTNLVDHIQ